MSTENSLNDRYYHWLASIYAHLIDTEQRAIDRQTDHIIDEACDEHLHPAGVYHPDMVDTLRLKIAEARNTLRQDRAAFSKEWHDIEADLAAKLLAVADPTEVQLNALKQPNPPKKP